MKKLIAVFAVACAVAFLPAFAFVGCGKKGEKTAKTTEYTVTFNYMGKADNETVKVEKGGKAKKPAVKVLEGLEVGGWYTDEALSQANAYKFSSEVTGDITLYAKWFDPYTYTEVEGGCAVNGYKGSATEAIIPSSYNNQPVVELQSTYNASQKMDVSIFYGKRVSKVTLPATLKTIGDSAFVWAKNVKSLVVPEGVETIGERAFADTDIVYIELPTTLTTIKRSAFNESDELASIVIPSGVEVIEDHAFSKCIKMKTVTIESAVIYNAATGSGDSTAGDLLQHVNTIYVLKSIVDDGLNENEYLNGENTKFTKTNGEDQYANYYVYTRNVD